MDYRKKYKKYKQKYLELKAGDFDCVRQADINAGYSFTDIPWCRQPYSGSGYNMCENIGLVTYTNSHLNGRQPVIPCYQAPVASPRTTQKSEPSIEPQHSSWE